MYVKQSPRPTLFTLPARVLMTLGFTGLLFCFAGTASAQPKVIRNITEPSQRLEMTVNTSRILTLDKRVPKMVVNNPELVSVTPISATQVQIAAKKPGVTQINLWDEDDKVYTVDLMIYGDVRELELALERLFPESSLKVMRLTNSLVLEGFVERPEAVGPIMRLAEDYAPKIVNNITVGGVQQVLLKVKVMEVSRTKLRDLGVDWAHFSGGNTTAVSSITGAIQALDPVFGSANADQQIKTFTFGITDGNNLFAGFLDALQQNNVAKVLADPTIVTVSGRPAKFHVGGEFAYLIPAGQGQVSVEFKDFGTQIDVLPIVLGNGNIRIEVRTEVSEIDNTLGTSLQGNNIPGLKTSNVDTGVEMKAGQTLALAGLVQTRIDAVERGLPFVSDLPFIGAAFRSVREKVNETELLIMITPEFVDGMDPHEVPQCGPGMETVSPTNCQLYWGGHLEVPSAGACGPNGCGAASYDTGCSSCGVSGAAYISDGGISNVTSAPMAMEVGAVQLQPQPAYINTGAHAIEMPMPTLEVSPQMPPVMQPGQPLPGGAPNAAGALDVPSTYRQSTPWSANQAGNGLQAPQNRSNPYVPATAQRPRTNTSTPGLMGPIGYDVEK